MKKFRGHLYQCDDGSFRLDTYEIEDGPEGRKVAHRKFLGWEMPQAMSAMQRMVMDSLVDQKNRGGITQTKEIPSTNP